MRRVFFHMAFFGGVIVNENITVASVDVQKNRFDVICNSYREMKKTVWKQLENGDKKAALETISDFRAGNGEMLDVALWEKMTGGDTWRTTKTGNITII